MNKIDRATTKEKYQFLVVHHKVGRYDPRHAELIVQLLDTITDMKKALEVAQTDRTPAGQERVQMFWDRFYSTFVD